MRCRSPSRWARTDKTNSGQVLDNEPENEITITVFRLLVLDLLALFQVANQGLINILGKFFEMTKTDAERAMGIYRTFTRQTELVVAYLSVARQHEHATRVEVPKLKHAPVHLARQLEDYLNDADFEINRRQYMAEQQAKGKGTLSLGAGAGSSTSKPTKTDDLGFPEPAANNPFPRSNGAKTTEFPKPAESKPQAAKGPEPDLIDFFESIEDKQTPMSTNPQPTGMPAQQTGFQQPMQGQPTGMQQNGFMQQQQPMFQSNNPFPQQMPDQQQQQQQQMGGFYQQQQPQPQQQQPQQLQPNFTGAGFGGFTPQPQPQQNFQPGALGSIPQESVANFQNQPQGLQPMQTGQPAQLQPMQTGSTNPFRQSMLMTQQTGLQSPPQSNLSSPAGSTPGLQRQSTNPFARSSPMQSPQDSGTGSPFQQQQPAPLQPTKTGTNPFARNASPQGGEARPQTAGGALAPQPTGTTNPFRQSAFVNHNTGLGWQHNQQPIGGGLDQLPTQQVFPRPAQQAPWQQ